MTETRICSKCANEKPLGCFSKRSGKRGGYQPHCKDCAAKQARQKYISGSRSKTRAAYLLSDAVCHTCQIAIIPGAETLYVLRTSEPNTYGGFISHESARSAAVARGFMVVPEIPDAWLSEREMKYGRIGGIWYGNTTKPQEAFHV
jgi:hypothetical protein